MLGEVETQGSTQLVGKPLPQYKPSASRRDATSEEKKNCNSKPCMSVSSKATYLINCQALGYCMYLLWQVPELYLQAKKLQFLGCLCKAPTSAGLELTILLQKGPVGPAAGNCSFGRQWRQP